MREKVISGRNLVTKRVARRRTVTRNRRSTMITSAKREAKRREAIIMTMPVRKVD